MAKENYVNNAAFLKALVAYKKKCLDAENSGQEKPIVPDYIGTCLYQIADRLSTKPNFSGYSYRDEMVADGLENAIRALGNFDTEKSNNPFAYFTQIIWYAFLRRIEIEKKQLYIRHKVIEDAVVSGTIIDKHPDDIGDAGFVDLNNDYMVDFVADYEKRMQDKRVKSLKSKKGLEKFVEDDE